MTIIVSTEIIINIIIIIIMIIVIVPAGPWKRIWRFPFNIMLRRGKRQLNLFRFFAIVLIFTVPSLVVLICVRDMKKDMPLGRFYFLFAFNKSVISFVVSHAKTMKITSGNLEEGFIGNCPTLYTKDNCLSKDKSVTLGKSLTAISL